MALQKIPEGLDGQTAAEIIYNNDSELAARISDVKGGVGNAQIGVPPEPSISTYNVSYAGTYPFYGGITVADADLVGKAVQFRLIGGVWQKFTTTIPGTLLPLFATAANIEIPADQKIIEITYPDGRLHISNLFDIYTGEPVSYTQTPDITADVQCDPVIARKYKGVYVKRDITTITPFNFGVKKVAATSTADVNSLDDSTALQFFFDTMQKYPEYPLNVTARVPIAKPILVSGYATRRVNGHLTLVKAYAPVAYFITGSAITFFNCGESIFDSLTVIMGGSNFGGTNGRGADFGVTLLNVRNTRFRRIFVIGARHYGIATPSRDMNGAVTNNNAMQIEDIVTNDCGVWNPGAIAFTEVSRNYLANSNNQYSVVSADFSLTEVMSFQPNMPLRVDNGDWHITLSYDDVAKTAVIWPCLRVAGYTGTYQIYNGGGFFNEGKDAGEFRINQFLATRCGKAFYTKSLYGGTVTGLITQNCGVGVTIGAATNSAVVGNKLISPYFEVNALDIFMCSVIAHLSIDDPIALSVDKVKRIAPIVTGADPSPSGWNLLSLNGWIGDSASFNASSAPFPLTAVTSNAIIAGVTGYDTVARTRTIDLASIGGSYSKTIRGEQGICYPIINCKSTDKLNIFAPTGETVNGKASILLQNLPPTFMLIVGRTTSTTWKAFIGPVNTFSADSYDSTNPTTTQGVSDLFKYTLKTGNTSIFPGSVNQLFECNTTVALTQTLLADVTTQAGTRLKFKNNGVNALTITPDVGVTIDGLATSIVLPSKSDHVTLIASAVNVWRIESASFVAAASANTATAAAAATPSKTEFDALLNELRDLKTKLKAAGKLN